MAKSVNNILKRNNLINRNIEKTQSAWHRFEHEASNRLWQMDFKGYFNMEDKQQCHPLTIVDDHSRYSILLKASANQKYLTVKEALSEVFWQYGLPERINTDNGQPWGSTIAH